MTYTKIWSTNPNLYKEISEEKAKAGYVDYLLHWLAWYIRDCNDDDIVKSPKSFDRWLETEI